MKSACISAILLFVFSCTPPAPKTEATTANAAVPTQDSLTDVKPDIKPDIKCQEKGKLIEKFTQNNALFERLSNEEKELEWLKITTKDGQCIILDDIKSANHYSVDFEDFDKDGFKDRVDNWKWDFSVSLFDKTKNDFSRHINGRFCGDQWDFDKSKNLKYQFLENKMGGVYELYQLNGNVKTVYSEINILNYDSDGNDANTNIIEIRKNIVRKGDDIKFDTLPVDAQLYKDTREMPNEAYEVELARTQKAIESYWRKNLSLFVKK